MHFGAPVGVGVGAGGANVVASWVWIEVVAGTTIGIAIGALFTAYALFRLGVLVR
jgi:hypothetical protein